jgi:uncharacterized protein YybS (DUF2232 family)
MDFGFLAIIIIFVSYYLILIFIEGKILQEPKEILDKFLSVLLFFAGISLIYFSLTGKVFPGDTIENYFVYIFIIGFIAVLWTVPNLLEEFSFFKKFVNKNKKGILKKK